MSSAFSPKEQLDLDLEALSPYTFQQVTPNRAELLEHFDDLLALLVSADEHLAQAHIDRFLDSLATVVDLAFGTRLKVKQVSSIITAKNSGGMEWSMTSPDTDLFGDFAGMLVGPWYDVPHGLKPKEPSIYERKHGLLLVLNNASLTCRDVPVAEIADDCAIVPLNYGKPELFRVLPAHTNL